MKNGLLIYWGARRRPQGRLARPWAWQHRAARLSRQQPLLPTAAWQREYLGVLGYSQHPLSPTLILLHILDLPHGRGDRALKCSQQALARLPPSPVTCRWLPTPGGICWGASAWTLQLVDLPKFLRRPPPQPPGCTSSPFLLYSQLCTPSRLLVTGSSMTLGLPWTSYQLDHLCGSARGERDGDEIQMQERQAELFLGEEWGL